MLAVKCTHLISCRLHTLCLLIRNQCRIQSIAHPECLVKIHTRCNLRNQGSSGLLCCTFSNALPAKALLLFLLRIQLHNRPLCCNRDNFINTKLHCLLNDQFHLIRLWQSLKQINLCRQFHKRMPAVNNIQTHFFLCQFCNFAEIIHSLTIADRHLFTRCHPQYIPDMIDICACDHNILITNLICPYKKSRHSCTPSTLNCSRNLMALLPL